MTGFRGFIIICSILIISCSKAPMMGEPGGENPAQAGRGLHYTCRHEGGQIIATTEKAVAESSEYEKSWVFLAKKEYAPIDITDYDPVQVGKKSAYPEQLEKVVQEKLSREAAEWAVGTERKLSVEAESQDHLSVNDREIVLARVKSVPKKAVYDRSVFRAMTRSKAVVGEPVNLYFGIQGKVVAVREKEVEVAFAPASEKPLEGPFGPVIVRDKGDYLETEIDIHKGDLVKVGSLVGQVSEVGERNFRADYSHPFGGRTLTCDVAVKVLEKRSTPSMQAEQKGAVGINPADSAAGSVAGSQTPPTAVKGDPSKVVEAGDLVKVAYTATLESGELLRTTHADVAANPDQKKIERFWQDAFGPETILAGGQEDFPGLAYAVMGLKHGDHKKVTVPPQKAFGARDLKQVSQYDRTRVVPATVTMSARAYMNRFKGGFPVKGKTIAYNAYVKGLIADVTEKGVVIKLTPVKEEIKDVFGVTRMSVENDKIHMFLTPKLGAKFELDKRKGRVVAVDSQKFTVDFNDPMAGESIVYDVQVLTLTKASEFSGLDIEWVEDHEQGLNKAKALNKPAVLLLHASWCGYCKKLFDTTLVDPRIESMHEDFVWIKVDSDKKQELKALYNQKSFPLTVLLNSDGEVIGNISGYRPAKTFRSEMMKVFDAKERILGLNQKK